MLTDAELQRFRGALNQITVRAELLGYLVDIVRATRSHESILVGAGPRATQSLLLACRAYAAIAGRDYVSPDDIKSLAVAVLEHRSFRKAAAAVLERERLLLRDPRLKVAVVDTVEVDDAKAPAFARDAARGGTALQLVVPGPAAFADGEDQADWVRKVMARRDANPCKYGPPAAVQAASAPAPSAAAPPAPTR